MQDQAEAAIGGPDRAQLAALGRSGPYLNLPSAGFALVLTLFPENSAKSIQAANWRNPESMNPCILAKVAFPWSN
jgi:hypothetical protein